MGHRVALLAVLVLAGCAKPEAPDPSEPDPNATPNVPAASGAPGKAKAVKGNDIVVNPNGNMSMPRQR